MRIVIFAHTPPPFHGQSYMVKLLLDGLGGDLRKTENERRTSLAANDVECFHVNAQFSGDLDEIGLFQVGKVFRLLRYCAEAVWCRFRYRASTLYYVPAPPKRIALYRDFVILLLCRPVFERVIFHWEASGLGEWVHGCASSWERWLARRLLGAPDLSVTLGAALSHDAVYFCSKQIRNVPNAIADPCQDFDTSVLPARRARLRRRKENLEGTVDPTGPIEIYRLVYLAHCTREKGFFDTLNAAVLANEQLTARACGVRVHVTLAGAFLRESERLEYDRWQRKNPGTADYVGFVTGEAKLRLLTESDCLCFPTFYSAEAQPVSIVEAMAFGLTVVATAWRGIPELLPPGYPLLIADHDPSVIAKALLQSLQSDLAADLRQRYIESFTAKRYVDNLRTAFRSIAGAAD